MTSIYRHLHLNSWTHPSTTTPTSRIVRTQAPTTRRHRHYSSVIRIVLCQLWRIKALSATCRLQSRCLKTLLRVACHGHLLLMNVITWFTTETITMRLMLTALLWSTRTSTQQKFIPVKLVFSRSGWYTVSPSSHVTSLLDVDLLCASRAHIVSAGWRRWRHTWVVTLFQHGGIDDDTDGLCRQQPTRHAHQTEAAPATRPRRRRRRRYPAETLV